jgi:iron complex outermembrane receptor protein
MGMSEFGGYFAEVDARVSIKPERLSAAVGGHYQRRYFADGRQGDYLALALLPTLRSEAFSITPFWSFAHSKVNAPSLLVTSGPSLPPERDRGGSTNQKWANSEQHSQTYGLVGLYDLSDRLSIRLGAFESRSVRTRTYNELFTNVQPDGSAIDIMVASPRLPARWTSGEARLSWVSDGTRFDQAIHLSLRGRDKQLEGGGSATVVLGPARIGKHTPRPQPDFSFTEPTVNSVRQWIVGIAHIGRLDGVGEFNLGLQKTGYRSTIERHDHSATTRSNPWLFNAMVAATPTKWLALYGGYTRGIEETAPPPQSAVNRDDATSASRTEQKEIGMRIAFGSARLLAGVFEIQRPYYSVDSQGVYGPLGLLTNRGVEASVSIQPTERLSIIAGAVVADPKVSGGALGTGRVSPLAVGTSRRSVRVDANWQSPVEGLSLDMSAAHSGAVAASTRTYEALGERQLMSTPFTTVDLGVRYRFQMNGLPVALRGLASNIFDDGGFDVNSSQSFFLRTGRRFSFQLLADL